MSHGNELLKVKDKSQADIDGRFEVNRSSPTKSTNTKSRYRQWYQSFATVRNTLDGIEAMRMIQKGQVRHVQKNVVKQNSFVRSLFGLAA